jgi:photosystem II stability/assembly factor-like uncharacterized protein
VARFPQFLAMLAIATGLPALTPARPQNQAVAASGEAEHPAPPARLASKGLLLDLARAGDRIVAVGDHGIVVVSDDEGVSWTQTSVPVQSMLTSVSFADPDHGWAGGHGGVLLATADGGLTWEKVENPTVEDDSFLDILALSRQHIIAVGAYGLYCESHDGGATWKTRYVLEEDTHINRLFFTRTGEILLAGESGTLALSTDAGKTWNPIASPYQGSLFGLIELTGGRWLIHGLRGHVYISDDRGANWHRVPIEQEVLLMAGVETSPGRVVLSGHGGWVFVSVTGGTTFTAKQPDDLSSASELLTSGSDTLIVAGISGVRRLPIP